MYRVLKKHDEVRVRRDRLKHPSYHQLGEQREKAGIIGCQAQSSVVVGHYQALGAKEMDVLLPLCDYRYL